MVWLSRFLWVGVVAVSAVGAVVSVGAHAGTLLAVGDGWGGRWGRGRGWWGDRVEAQPNGRKYNHAGENTTASCLWAGPNGRNHNWLLCLYKFGHALQKIHGTAFRFQHQSWILAVVIRPLSSRPSTNVEYNSDITCSIQGRCQRLANT